jgi:maltose O-acetyltransferase
MSFRKILQTIRILKYKLLSNCKTVIGNPKCNQPVQFIGGGRIMFGENVNLGYFPSPYFYNSSIYIEARNTESTIIFGDNIYINNNCVFIAEGEGIEIGSNTLVGANCEIIDSDFHDLHSDRRTNGKPKTAKVIVGKNVFIGNNVKIMKGVRIGDNSIIANSSIVLKSIPGNIIAGGNPAIIIKNVL